MHRADWLTTEAYADAASPGDTLDPMNPYWFGADSGSGFDGDCQYPNHLFPHL